MYPQAHQARQLVLEQMIDGTSLRNVLDDLAQVCADKAQHIEENWQDRPLARVWDEASKAVLACRGRVAI